MYTPPVINTEVLKIFEEIFSKITRSVEFEMKWSDGEGGFPHAVIGDYAPLLAPGEMVKSISPGNRRIVIIGTLNGNLVLYDRKCVGRKKTPTGEIGYDSTYEIAQKYYLSGHITEDQLIGLTGYPTMIWNLGIK